LVAATVGVVTGPVAGQAMAAPVATHGAQHTKKKSKVKVVFAKPRLAGAHIVLSGRTSPRTTVRIQVRRAAGWRPLGHTKADGVGRFSMTAQRPAGAQVLRATVAGHVSPTQKVVPPSDACGVRPVKADGTLWSCSFVDNFDGTSLDSSKWTPQQLAGNGGDLCYASSDQTISVSGGALHLAVVPTGDGTECPARPDGSRASYAGASVTTWHQFGQQYGRFEARIRNPATTRPGIHDAFWLWPDTRTTSDADWPNTGEIDVMENYTSQASLDIPFLHYSADSGGAVQGLNTTYSATATPGAWHTYDLTWTADKLQIAVDGKTILTNTAGASSFRKAFIVDLTQILGNGTDAYNGKVALPSTMDVDYVKVWK